MKKLKSFIIAIMLISILATSICFCACNNDSNNDGTSSGNMPSGKPTKPTLPGLLFPSKEPTTEEPSSGEPEEPSLKDADWIKIYTFNGSLKQDDYSAIINSVEDLLAMCDEDTSPVFKKDRYTSNKTIIDKLKAYDEEFFKDKSLVVIFGWQSGGIYYVKDFEIDGECLNITLKNEMKAGVIYPDDAYNCVYLLEFPKEQVKDVTTINVDQIFVIKK